MPTFFGPMLATDLSSCGWPKGVPFLFAEPKLDGYRCCAVISGGAVTFYCRDDKPTVWGANLGHIAEALLALGLDECMVDGEVMAGDPGPKNYNKTGIIRSGCSSRGGVDVYTPPPDDVVEEIRRTVRLHIFDLVDLDAGAVVVRTEPGARKSFPVYDVPYVDRRASLSARFTLVPAGSPLSMVPARLVKAGELITAMDQSVEAGYEGLILKRGTSDYHFRRSKDWLKLKLFETRELQVLEVIPGEGKHAGRMGALRCVDAAGQEVSVGTGFSDAEREAPIQVGAILEIRQQQGDVAASRHPSFLRWRPDRSKL